MFNITYIIRHTIQTESVEGNAMQVSLLVLATCCFLPLLSACRSGPDPKSSYPIEASAPIPAADPAQVEPEWKERLAEVYLYVEHIGDYRGVGDALRQLFQEARRAGVTPAGPPFTLYFDDPGRVPFDRLRSRACLPIDPNVGGLPASLPQDILPQAMVVYGRVSGPYDLVPRAYPKLMAYMEEHAWSPNGPIREVYLVDPAAVESWDELVTEVQIPWTVR